MGEAEGGNDDEGAECFFARMRSGGAQFAGGAAKARLSDRLDQRRGLWGQTHAGRRCGLPSRTSAPITNYLNSES